MVCIGFRKLQIEVDLKIGGGSSPPLNLINLEDFPILEKNPFFAAL